MSAEEWDWLQHVVDHLDVHASDYDASVRFYATVLTPLGIPSWTEDSDTERATCFTRVNVVDRRPATKTSTFASLRSHASKSTPSIERA